MMWFVNAIDFSSNLLLHIMNYIHLTLGSPYEVIIVLIGYSALIVVAVMFALRWFRNGFAFVVIVIPTMVVGLLPMGHAQIKFDEQFYECREEKHRLDVGTPVVVTYCRYLEDYKLDGDWTEWKKSGVYFPGDTK